MIVEFIANTGFNLVSDQKIFTCDPWLSQGAFEGAWYHFPPLCDTRYDFRNAKYVYISHVHPDHYDPASLRQINKSCTFIVPDYFNRLLERNLREMGFDRIVSLHPGENRELEPGLRVFMFGLTNGRTCRGYLC